jgi:hypothetical protein
MMVWRARRMGMLLPFGIETARGLNDEEEIEECRLLRYRAA